MDNRRSGPTREHEIAGLIEEYDYRIKKISSTQAELLNGTEMGIDDKLINAPGYEYSKDDLEKTRKKYNRTKAMKQQRENTLAEINVLKRIIADPYKCAEEIAKDGLEKYLSSNVKSREQRDANMAIFMGLEAKKHQLKERITRMENGIVATNGGHKNGDE